VVRSGGQDVLRILAFPPAERLAGCDPLPEVRGFVLAVPRLCAPPGQPPLRLAAGAANTEAR
jgi:hypothetical protein